MTEMNETNVVERTEEIVNPYDKVVDLQESASEGKSNKMIGLVIAGVAALTAGAVVLFRKHKKMQKENLEILEEDNDFDDFYDESYDEEIDHVVDVTAEVQEIVENSDKK